MTTNSILLAVTDPQIPAEIKQALGDGWDTTSVTNEADALAQLEQRSFDALLVDFNLGDSDASDLLNHALEKHPETVRFLLAYEADLALIAAKVAGSHQILPKPIEPGSLKSRIESGVNDAKPDENGNDQPKEPGRAPTIPSVYAEVLKALDSPDATSAQLGELISSDGALTIEVLRLTRSTYLGLPRNLTDPAEAVECLGLETVKALVMALRFLAEHSQLKPGYLSVDQIWQHSTNVAQIARDLVLFETKDRALAAQAFAAGLLHDLGKVVLATNFDDLYGRVHSLARKQPVPLWEIEKEMFGATHGEIGACLVGMWNLPAPIVEAAGFHHEPPLGEHDELTPLAAVHIANVLEHELRPNEEFRVAPIINTTFLNDLGLLQRLPVWRATAANRGSANNPSQVESAESDQSQSLTPQVESSQFSRTGYLLPGRAASTRTATSGQPSDDSTQRPASPFLQRRWAYGGIAAGVLFLLALWLRTEPAVDQSAPVYARTPVTHQTPALTQTPAVETSTSPKETVPAASPQVTPAKAALEPAAAITSPAVAQPTEPAISQPPHESAPGPIIVSHETADPVMPPSAPPAPEFRLSGIFYTPPRPSAILNGETVFVGDQVNGARVLTIGQTAVTLQVDGQRKTLTLR
jgi:HD-like signal output (HDOD) protein/CheY-like chemotaxis protein